MANKNNQAQDAQTTGIENLDESLSSFSSKVEKHRKKIGLAVTAIIVVAVAVIGFIFWNRHTDAESARKYSGVESKVMTQAMKADPAVQDSVYKAAKMKELQAIAKSEAGKAGGNLANLDLAGMYYESGKYNEAIKCLNDAQIDEPAMKASAKILLADCYVNVKKYGEALSALDEAANAAVDTPEIAVRALLKKALVLDEQKKYNDALAVYEKIIADYPQAAAQISAAGMNVEAYAERERARLGK